MATEDGREDHGLIRDLFRAPHRFDFFQAVRLLEHLARERVGPDGARRPVGHDDPLDEVASFRAQPSLIFPVSPITRIQDAIPPAGGRRADPLPELIVTFLGLTGPSGVLPRHYTELLIQRIREKDYSLRDFLDLFHHRLISLFYRAWEKYRLAMGYERSQRDDPAGEPDAVTQGLYCLVGMGLPGLRRRLEVKDEVFLHYAGHFAHYPRSASALEGLLEDYLEVPTRVIQAQGQWLALDPDDWATLPDGRHPRGRNNALGVNLIVGDRIWDVQSKFRLRLGPMNWQQFRSLLPNGAALRPLSQLTRTYVGAELDFDVQPVVSPEEIPPCRLAPHPEEGPYLSWTTWLEDPARDRPVDDAVFEVRDF